MKWLMSQEARDQQFDAFKHKDKVIEATNLAGMDRELTLYEIAQMTRAGPAKALGLAHMYGGLAPGLDGDVAVYDFNPNEPYAPDDIEKAFLNAKHLFKSGVQVISDHEIASNGNKRTLWVNAKANENPQVMRDIKEKFLRYYTVTLNNYEVTGHYLRNPHVIEVDATQ
jgi:formylmethanofuran dehydrogenase subunit A